MSFLNGSVNGNVLATIRDISSFSHFASLHPILAALSGVDPSTLLSQLPNKTCGAIELAMAVAIGKYRTTTPGAPPRSAGSQEERAIAAARLQAGKANGLWAGLLTGIWPKGRA